MAERTKERMKQTGEFFTPPELVNEILDKLPEDRNLWNDSTKTWLDPTCGTGNFLIEIKARLLMANHNEEHILEKMIFGVDIMPDNVEECILRLWGDGDIKELKDDKIPQEMQHDSVISVFTHAKPGHSSKLIRNIVCADSLTYDFSFGRKSDNPEGWNDIGLSF